MPDLIIRAERKDPSDLDWLRTRAIAAVEELIEDQREEGRLDGEVAVFWDIED